MLSHHASSSVSGFSAGISRTSPLSRSSNTIYRLSCKTFSIFKQSQNKTKFQTHSHFSSNLEKRISTSSGSSTTSTSLTTLGWSNFFMIAISRYTCHKISASLLLFNQLSRFHRTRSNRAVMMQKSRDWWSNNDEHSDYYVKDDDDDDDDKREQWALALEWRLDNRQRSGGPIFRCASISCFQAVSK